MATEIESKLSSVAPVAARWVSSYGAKPIGRSSSKANVGRQACVSTIARNACAVKATADQSTFDSDVSAAPVARKASSRPANGERPANRSDKNLARAPVRPAAA